MLRLSSYRRLHQDWSKVKAGKIHCVVAVGMLDPSAQRFVMDRTYWNHFTIITAVKPSDSYSDKPLEVGEAPSLIASPQIHCGPGFSICSSKLGKAPSSMGLSSSFHLIVRRKNS